MCFTYNLNNISCELAGARRRQTNVVESCIEYKENVRQLANITLMSNPDHKAAWIQDYVRIPKHS